MALSAREIYERGVVDFYGRDFVVTPDVLIPRPETEMIIDAVLDLAGKSFIAGVKPAKRILDAVPRILDVGTGSGCIAITLSAELNEAEVTAVDVSDAALKVARKNAGKMGTKVRFIKSDLMRKVSGDFDVVVANLPYVNKNWEWLDTEALSVEPELALYAEDDGCALIFELIRQASGRTKFLILEADPLQHERIIDFAKQNGFYLREVRGFALVFSS